MKMVVTDISMAAQYHKEHALEPQVQPRVLVIKASIAAASPFSPATWVCSGCHERNDMSALKCRRADCRQDYKRGGLCLDRKGNRVMPARFPAHWVCSTCHDVHSILEVLLKMASCDCGEPTLQAVYDQFGDLFLFWREDPAIHDLKDPVKAEEAARRLWQAGSSPWLGEIPKIVFEREDRAAVDEVPMLCVYLPHRLSWIVRSY